MLFDSSGQYKKKSNICDLWKCNEFKKENSIYDL